MDARATLSISLTLANRSRDLRGSIYLGRATLCQDPLLHSRTCFFSFPSIVRAKIRAKENEKQIVCKKKSPIISLLPIRKKIFRRISTFRTIYERRRHRSLIKRSLFRAYSVPSRVANVSLSRNMAERSTRIYIRGKKEKLGGK